MATPSGRWKPSWRKASIDERNNFKRLLDLKLEMFTIPTEITECRDPKCKDETHIEVIDWFTSELLSGDLQNGNKRIVPGFTAKVKPLKETALFWFNLWKSAGSPRDSHS